MFAVVWLKTDLPLLLYVHTNERTKRIPNLLAMSGERFNKYKAKHKIWMNLVGWQCTEFKFENKILKYILIYGFVILNKI